MMTETLFIRATKARSPKRLLICVICTAIFLLANWRFAPLFELENHASDWFQRLGRRTPMDSRLVLIGIDRPAYDEVILKTEAASDPVLAALRERFPWERKVWTALVERLAKAGAKTIVVDLFFRGATADDAALREVLDRYADRVVIGSQIVIEQTARGEYSSVIAPSGTLIGSEDAPGLFDKRVGFVNAWADKDNVVRGTRFRASNRELSGMLPGTPDATIESLAARALAAFGEAARVPRSNGFQRFRFTGPPGEWNEIPIGDVLTPKLWEANFGGGKFFRDKLVLIGPTATIFQDLHPTPFKAPMRGQEIHLNVINAALHGEFIHELSRWGDSALILLAGLVAAALSQSVRQPARRLVSLVGLSVAYLLAAFWLFNHFNLSMVVITPGLTLTCAGLALLGDDFIAERLERMKLSHTMGLYFSPSVLRAVLNDQGSMTPRSAAVCMLMTDLRNSTPLAELLGPEGMFQLLNNVFAVQTEAVMSEQGNLEHFLGDQFLSYWGAPKQQTDAADLSLRAAQKLIVGMENLRAGLPDPVAKLFGYGVALHSGVVLVGNKGSAQRMDYGLVGDAVNEAARIEALTKFYGVRLIVSRDTIAQLTKQGTRRLLDQVIVKGKSAPVDLFECENPAVPRYFSELCQRYKAAYSEYVFGRFTVAQALFENLANEFTDEPSRVLAERCRELAKTPPTDWKAVWKLENK